MPDLKNLLQKVTTKMIFPKLLSFKEKDEDFWLIKKTRMNVNSFQDRENVIPCQANAEQMPSRCQSNVNQIPSIYQGNANANCKQTEHCPSIENFSGQEKNIFFQAFRQSSKGMKIYKLHQQCKWNHELWKSFKIWGFFQLWFNHHIVITWIARILAIKNWI